MAEYSPITGVKVGDDTLKWGVKLALFVVAVILAMLAYAVYKLVSGLGSGAKAGASAVKSGVETITEGVAQYFAFDGKSPEEYGYATSAGQTDLRVLYNQERVAKVGYTYVGFPTYEQWLNERNK